MHIDSNRWENAKFFHGFYKIIESFTNDTKVCKTAMQKTNRWPCISIIVKFNDETFPKNAMSDWL